MNRIKQLRNEEGLTLVELSKKVQIPNNILSQYENEKRNPKPETWQALADYFDVLVPYLRGATIYEILDPLEKGFYSHVTEAMDRAFNDYALSPLQRERILKAIAYSIDYGEFN